MAPKLTLNLKPEQYQSACKIKTVLLYYDLIWKWSTKIVNHESSHLDLQ